jgi:hypothetical protein
MAASCVGDAGDRALRPYVARVWLAAMTLCCGLLPRQRRRSAKGKRAYERRRDEPPSISLGCGAAWEGLSPTAIIAEL